MLSGEVVPPGASPAAILAAALDGGGYTVRSRIPVLARAIEAVPSSSDGHGVLEECLVARLVRFCLSATMESLMHGPGSACAEAAEAYLSLLEVAMGKGFLPFHPLPPRPGFPYPLTVAGDLVAMLAEVEDDLYMQASPTPLTWSMVARVVEALSCHGLGLDARLAAAGAASPTLRQALSRFPAMAPHLGRLDALGLSNALPAAPPLPRARL